MRELMSRSEIARQVLIKILDILSLCRGPQRR